MTTNDPAERLLMMLVGDPRHDLARAALAAERRATVERIRAALRKHLTASDAIVRIRQESLDAILDAEAER